MLPSRDAAPAGPGSSVPPRMIFHVPYPLQGAGASGSGIRPGRMLAAFRDLGLDVTVVAGSAAERKRQIADVSRALAAGEHYDFCYSESSTMPTALTEPNHLPLHPAMDLAFLARLRRRGTKVGLFYRDVYWRFPSYAETTKAPQRWVAKAFYTADLLAYRRAVDVLYLPSLPMADHVSPGHPHPVALPPGHDDPPLTPVDPSPPRLLYVGGLGEYYNLTTVVTALKRCHDEGLDVHLVLCTPEKLWQAEKATYEPLLSPAVTVVHESGEQLRQRYAETNIATLALEPNLYRSFAAPVKQYEAIGMGKPLLATEGTLTAELVRSTGAGWVVPDEVDACVELLRRLHDHPDEVAEASARSAALRESHSWRARARQVVEELTGRTLS
ncbi:glycosyltransferase family 4 protein [Aestuariimicrobium soli]|uniref:glycosyltransferase family 4 protein n=1 Tax=Aestuariimicrobium soli TaxID=2035834 RepID=UPI003EB99C7C